MGNPSNIHICLLIILHTIITSRCQDPDITPSSANLNYGNGSDSAQVLDVYLPTKIHIKEVSHVVILIHGGAWSGGSKSDSYMIEIISFLRQTFPTYLIANMEYRLGTWESPGYPKQIEDIASVITFIKERFPRKYLTFALCGGSAGGHLALLYAYRFDTNKDVGIVIDVVGPSDLTDPAYTMNLIYYPISNSWVGPNLYLLNPSIYKDTSPVTWITKDSPKTIGFYGDSDFLIPNSQHKRLRSKLNKAGVINEIVVYKGGHFFDWSKADVKNMKMRIVRFLNKHFH